MMAEIRADAVVKTGDGPLSVNSGAPVGPVTEAPLPASRSRHKVKAAEMDARRQFRMPTVSVLSSWCVCTHSDKIDKRVEDILDLPEDTPENERMRQLMDIPIPGLTLALQKGNDFFDLYLLDHKEIPVYALAAKMDNDLREWKGKSDSPFLTPTAFLSFLWTGRADCTDFVPDAENEAAGKTRIDLIAKFLLRKLSYDFRGRGIGRRPRILGISTHFGHLSLPYRGCTKERDGVDDRYLRAASINSVRAARYLAQILGINCVELVCGASVPRPLPPVESPWEDITRLTPEPFRTLREKTLVESLIEVFKAADDITTRVALEIEPGPAYLLRDLDAFERVYNRFIEHEQSPARSNPRKLLGLNADLAHFFLVGLGKPADLVWKAISHEDRPYLGELIFGVHISDHAGDWSIGGTHASDLAPGSLHMQSEYLPWLDFLCDPEQTPNFSGVLAVEMEANFGVEEVLTARDVVRRWLRKLGEKHDPDERAWLVDGPGTPDVPHEGALLVFDIGNSTRRFGNSPDNLRALLEHLCQVARDRGGSALSFTGDGLIVHFEERFLPGQAARIAADFAIRLHHEMEVVLDNLPPVNLPPEIEKLPGDSVVALPVRCGLHWGACHIVETGLLKENAIGRNVILAARLCAWLGDLEGWYRRSGNQFALLTPNQTAATGTFLRHLLPSHVDSMNSVRAPRVLTDPSGGDWEFRGDHPDFKGLDGPKITPEPIWHFVPRTAESLHRPPEGDPSRA